MTDGAIQTVKFFVPGDPVAAPRMTQRDKWAQRPCVMRYRAWKDACRLIARGKIPPVDKIISLNWTATFEPPASWSAKKKEAAFGQPHRSKPDLDNLAKGVMDAMFVDDQGIARGTFAKLWGKVAGVEIEIVFEVARPNG